MEVDAESIRICQKKLAKDMCFTKHHLVRLRAGDDDSQSKSLPVLHVQAYAKSNS